MMPAIALSPRLELLHAKPETLRASLALDALARAAAQAGSHITVSTKHAGAAPVLLLWGPGAPDRIAAIKTQIAAGGHVVALDLAYWSRQEKFRVSIDGPHPQAYVMRRELSPTRFAADPVLVANRWNPNGPILVAGIGQKARVQYGPSATLAWEDAMIAEARARWRRPVIYRKKTPDAALPSGAHAAPPGTIDQVLAGCSLVITWHSNVAVDAIRLGIPAVCVDGAAAAVCPSVLPDEPVPLPVDVRDRFLANLAWFQWAPREAAVAWKFLAGCLA